MAFAASIILLSPLALPAALVTVAVIALAALYVATRPGRLPESAAPQAD
jgi:hypothetical protein